MSRNKLDILLGLIGTGAFIPGLLEILFGFTGETYTWGIVTFSGNFTLWRGLILLAAGSLFFFAINQSNPVQKRAQAVLAGAMICIIGGIEALSVLLNSIAGGEGRWISTASGFLSYYTGPFIPSLVLLPFSVGFIILVTGDGKKNDQ